MTNQPPAEQTEPQPNPSVESTTNISDGIGIDAQHDVNIGGDVVGRDKITEIVEGDKIAGDKHVEQEVSATGRGIAIGKLNVPLVPLMVALGAGLVMLIFIGAMTALVGRDVRRFAPTPLPEKMAGDIRVAVAEFGVMNEQNEIVASTEGQQYAQSFVAEIKKNLDLLDEELQAIEPKYQIALRGPPEVRLVEGSAPAARQEDAKKVATEHNANIVIYGYLTIKVGRTDFNPELYVSDQFLRGAEELTGAHEFGAACKVGADIQANFPASANLRECVAKETRAFAIFLVGLGYYGLGNYERAEKSFEEALATEDPENKTVRKIYYLFAGKTAQEYAASLPPSAQQAQKQFELWNEAQTFYQKALAISPEYARAQLGYADMVFQKAKGECTPESVDAEGLQAAVDGFQRARTAADQIPDANIDHKTAFYLGRAYLCQSLAGADKWAEAERETQKVIDQYDEGDKRFKEVARGRAVEAHAFLGMIYLMRPDDNLLLAAQEYRNAIKLNGETVASDHWLDYQALLYMKLAVIYEFVPDYAEADKAWDEAIRYDMLWHAQAGLEVPTPSQYQTMRETYALDRPEPFRPLPIATP